MRTVEAATSAKVRGFPCTALYATIAWIAAPSSPPPPRRHLDRCARGIRKKLSPCPRPRAPADDLDHLALLPGKHQVQPVQDSKADAFNRRANQMIRREVCWRKCHAVMPRACGRSGVRSPFRNGRKTSPSAPGGVDSSAASMSATVLPSNCTVPVTTFVAFIVQTSGSQPPDEEQNGATLPEGSMRGLLADRSTPWTTCPGSA